MLNSDKKNYLLLLIVFLLVFTIMLPLKDQLFSDDFAYAQSVRHLISAGDIKVSDRVAPSSIALIVWGAMFTKVSGFSLANLHFTVIALLPFMLFALYKLLKVFGCSKQISLIFTLFLFTIPWVLQISYTFLTDIPFLVLEVFALLFYLLGFKQHKKTYLLLGSVFASLAFLTRQLGIALIISSTISIIFSINISRREKGIILIFLNLVPTMVIFGYYLWVSNPVNKTIPQYFYENYISESLKTFIPYTNIHATTRISNLSTYVHTSINYISQALGLFFPLTVIFILSNVHALFEFTKKHLKFIFVSTIPTVFIFLLDYLNFKETYTTGFPLIIYEYEKLFPIPWAHIWKLMVIVSLPICSVAFAWSITKIHMLSKLNRPETLFLIVSFLLLTFITVISPATWDLYIIPFLPFILLWIAHVTKSFKFNIKLALVVVLILFLDTIQMTKLRYTQSALIWENAMKLVGSGVSPLEIDPNNNYAWHYWFYFEKLASDSIKANHGSKENLSYGFVIKKPDQPKYRFYTDKMIKYTNLNTKNYQTEEIPYASFLVKSKIYSFKLNDR